jgi:hypothetical protein
LRFSERELVWWFVFALALTVTRIDHLGGPVSLPDAAFAVFLLAGLWLRRAVVYVSLAALAFAIDLWATRVAGVDDYCFTPAYGFLLLAYAGLFWLPRGSRALQRLDVQLRAASLPTGRELGLATAVAVLGWTLAFAVSNLSFYGFSGRFTELSLRDYVAATWHYVVPYVGYAVLYATLLFAVRFALAARGLAPHRQSAL